MTQIPHQLTKNVKLLHKVVITNQDQVLILKRDEGSASRPNCWDLPGGNSEWPEEGTQSGFDYHARDIVREIQEETGIAAQANMFDESKLIYLHTYFDAQKQIYTIICGWILNLEQRPEVILSHEHIDQAWTAQDSLDAYDFGGKKGDFIKQIVKNALDSTN